MLLLFQEVRSRGAFMARARKIGRLETFDYSSSGLYFVTFCTHGRTCSLSRIEDDLEDLFGEAKVCLSPLGRICEDVAGELRDHFPEFELEMFVIMPNHVHGLVAVSGQNSQPSRKTLGDYVGAWKRETTRRAHLSGISGHIWQEQFHDHIVRNEAEGNRIREYIQNNPCKWSLDCFYAG